MKIYLRSRDKNIAAVVPVTPTQSSPQAHSIISSLMKSRLKSHRVSEDVTIGSSVMTNTMYNHGVFGHQMGSGVSESPQKVEQYK